MKRLQTMSLVIALAAALLAGCGGETVQSDQTQVVATTTIVGDVVAQIAGDSIQVKVLLPLGSDPHSFQPTPQDLVAVEEAALLFVNGFDLEQFLGDLLEDNVDQDKIIEVSEGISPLYFDESAEEHEEHEGEEGHHHEGVDPHVWMNPLNVVVWVENITAALVELDPENAADYQANADAYTQELVEMDEWAKEQFATVPAEQRLLVSDHQTFNYLAEAYDLEVVGALTGFSSLAESSAQELAELEDAINELGVKAIFVSTTVPADLAERVAEDTGVQVVPVYTGSLSEADGPAPTYLDLIHDIISKMVSALN